MTDPRDILLLRADAIGDHVLAAGLIPLLKDRWPGARITVLCPEPAAGLFDACPWVARVVTFRPRRLRRLRHSLPLRLKLMRTYDLALNTVLSRDSAVDRLAKLVSATRFVAFRGDACNQSSESLRRNDAAYSELVELGEEPLHALDSLQRFAAHLGLAGEVRPAAWRSPEDDAWARGILSTPPEPAAALPVLAFFPGAGSPIRHYPGFAEALSAFLSATPARVVCLGAPADRAWCAEILGCLPGSGHLNLCGGTTLGQAAAVLALARLAAGAETGLAHLAWAVGTPHAVVLGGGHFGRFMPGSELSTAACLPMDCFGCNWQCRFDRPVCIQDLPARAFEVALRQAWGAPAGEARLCFPDPTPLAAHGIDGRALRTPRPSRPVPVAAGDPRPPEA